MKLAALAAIALIGSGFGPIELPGMLGMAAAQPFPNVLLCTDTSLLGAPGSGHFWGTPFILPSQNRVTGRLNPPTSEDDADVYLGGVTISLDAVIQRCPVMNRTGKPTGKYQDVELRVEHRTTYGIRCVHTGEETVPPPYLNCQLEDLPGGSPDDR